MKYLKSCILFIFRSRYNSNEFRHFKGLMQSFYDNYDPEFEFNRYRITKCRLYSLPSSILIEIHSLSPGMIIGKGGKCYDDLKTFMQKRYTKPVTIKLEETNPFK
jgi:hypothetical protein